MRFIHTSDWHLGQNFYGKNRAAEHQAFFDWLLETIAAKQVELLVVAGDIYDTAAPPSYARSLLNKLVIQLHEVGCQLLLLGGNHDSVAVLNENKNLYKALNTSLISQAANKQDSVNYQQQVQLMTDKDGQASAILVAVPYLRPRDLYTANSIDSETDQTNNKLLPAIQQHYQQLYQIALEKQQQIANDIGTKVPIIGTAHLTIVNAKITDSVRDIYIGSLEAVPIEALPEFDYLAMGHIHQPQVIGKKEQIRYSGSPIAMSFDEASQQKSVVLVDTNAEQTENLHISTLDIPCSQAMRQLKGDIQQIEDELAQLAALEQNIWLDIEISSDEYHSDLQQKLLSLTVDSELEILRVRRSKKVIQQKLAEKSVSLDELTPLDVFNQRVANLELTTEQIQDLTQLFNQSHQQSLSEENENS
ncbi:exonuclease subunit SbcD [Catenovulum agarivorans]|uniref:exonuclease subunit SbcD n=1 Tax=Catenovulum agarivorans TaxID=1172192 RepID=UPI000315DE88|nr:exonuclease subunit SbcD [Catenovulum agarivorans]